jgi:hypothetical protein
MTGYVKEVKKVKQWTMDACDYYGTAVLAFDNMQNRD